MSFIELNPVYEYIFFYDNDCYNYDENILNIYIIN